MNEMSERKKLIDTINDRYDFIQRRLEGILGDLKNKENSREVIACQIELLLQDLN